MGGEILPPEKEQDMRTTVEAKGKGHFEIEFMDGLNGIAIYEKTLAEVIELLSGLDRVVKSISWVED